MPWFASRMMLRHSAHCRYLQVILSLTMLVCAAWFCKCLATFKNSQIVPLDCYILPPLQDVFISSAWSPLHLSAPPGATLHVLSHVRR